MFMLYVAYRILHEQPNVNIVCGNGRMGPKDVIFINTGGTDANLVSLDMTQEP